MAVKIVTDTTFKEEIDHPKVIIKFYADWCGSCKLFAPKFKRLSDDERFKDTLFLEVNAEHNPEARKLASVSTLPFFATFRNGTLADTVSTTKEEALLTVLEKI